MASLKNLVIDQGTTFIEYVLYKDKNKNAIDISGMNSRAQMRKSYYSANATTFSTTISSNINGNVTISLTASETANLKAGRYVYDVEVYNSNVVYRIQEGAITVYPEVTK